jgi:hypothetical protein
MTLKHGKNAAVLLGSVDLSPYLNSADLSVDVDVADTTTFSATWKTAIPGTIGAKVDLAGLYDPAEATLPTLLLSMVPGVLTVAPAGGAAIGDLARLLSVHDASYAESSPVGGVVAVKASLAATGTVGIGYVLHPLAEDTNTTTGADRDDGAETSTGWTAHLHVTAVDGGSWVVKLQDAATNDWADVSPAIAFTAATGATSQRLVSATATATLRQHVRYIATRTGGTAGDGITFALALARN